MAIDIKPEELIPAVAREINGSDRQRFETSKFLQRASRQATDRKYYDFLIVDADAHHYENEAWDDIIKYIEDPVLRRRAENAHRAGVPNLNILHTQPTRQNVDGRIQTTTARRSERAGHASVAEAEVTLIRNEMDAIGLDYQVVFPTPMLNLGMHPDHQVEVQMSWAYSRWLVEEILPRDPRMKTMVYLPFNTPKACKRVIEYFTGKTGVVGFEVTSSRYRPVHDNEYMPIYRMLEERDMPVAFHAGYHDWERAFAGMNKFISVHSIGFVIYNIIHMINLVVNGIPERFPELKVLWIEQGLAWLPFIMQRLDNEYTMRTSECPLLKKLPSDYMRDFFYTTQPMELVNNRALEFSMKKMHAETQLLFASDYPHWDFNLPSTIYDLPFLSEQAKRNILGQNAAKLFKLEDKKVKPRATAAA